MENGSHDEKNAEESLLVSPARFGRGNNRKISLTKWNRIAIIVTARRPRVQRETQGTGFNGNHGKLPCITLASTGKTTTTTTYSDGVMKGTFHSTRVA